MSNVRRVYVEKKGSYDVQQKALAHEIRNYLGIKDVEYVRILNRYDVENVSDETFERACNGIFAEPPVDVLWKEEAPVGSGDSLFSVEFLKLFLFHILKSVKYNNISRLIKFCH